MMKLLWMASAISAIALAQTQTSALAQPEFEVASIKTLNLEGQ
jgi:hypothetical protein